MFILVYRDHLEDMRVFYCKGIQSAEDKAVELASEEFGMPLHDFDALRELEQVENFAVDIFLLENHAADADIIELTDC